MRDYNVFDTLHLNMVTSFDNVLLKYNTLYAHIYDTYELYNLLSQRYVFMRNTKIKDANKNFIFEYDLIEFTKRAGNKEFKFTGIVLFRKSSFVVRDIFYLEQLLYDEKYELMLNEVLNKYENIKVIASSLEVKKYQNNIRNRFLFKVVDNETNKPIENCYIDNNCNIYSIADVRKKETYILMNNGKLLLSIGIYDLNGNIIYDKDKISFDYINQKYTGNVEYEKGTYYIENIKNAYGHKTNLKIPIYISKTNDELSNIKLI